jgi:hypothetical protein
MVFPIIVVLTYTRPLTQLVCHFEFYVWLLFLSMMHHGSAYKVIKVGSHRVPTSVNFLEVCRTCFYNKIYISPSCFSLM